MSCLFNIIFVCVNLMEFARVSRMCDWGGRVARWESGYVIKKEKKTDERNKVREDEEKERLQ